MSKSKACLSRKLICLFLVMGLIITSFSLSAAAGGSKNDKGTNYPTIFVHGYGGYGQYDKMYKVYPYWGMRSGDIVAYLNKQGYESYAASVDPVGSAWDRACELYAQLTGSIVDYGEAHSALYNHERFGTDYSKNPLITGWGEQDASGALKKVNFMGHSFGGATVRLLAQLLANGSQDEVNKTGNGVSGLFTGDKSAWVHSITTLASPHNGTTMLYLNQQITGKVSNNSTQEDTGTYDLTLDGAARLNENLSPLADTYYFSFAADCTTPAKCSNKRLPNLKLADMIFLFNGLYMGSSTGVSPGGIVYDESWFNNDGVVNTISSKAPAHEAQQAFDSYNITPGIWNIMETFKGDHASIVGGVIRKVDIFPFYLAQVRLIDSL